MIRSFINLVVGRLGQSLIGLLNIIILLRLLNKTDYGYYAFIIAFTTIFSVIAQFGLTSGLSRLINLHLKEKDILHTIILKSFSIQLVTFLSSLAILFIVQWLYLPQFADYLDSFTFFGEISFIASIIMSEHFFRSARILNKFNNISFCIVLLGGSRLAGFIIPYLITKNFSVSFFFFGVSQFFVSSVFFFNFFLGNKLLTNLKFTGKKFNVFNASTPFFIIAVSNILFSQIGHIIIGKYIDLKHVAEFDAVFRVINILRIPAVAFSFIISSEIGKHIRNKNRSAVSDTINKNFNFFLLSLPMAVLIIIYSYPLMNLLGGSEYAKSYYLLNGLTLYFICAFFSDTFSLTLDYSNSFKKRSYVVVISAVTNIVLMIVLVRLYNLTGAIASLTAASAVQVTIFIILIKKEFNLELKLNRYTFFILFSTILFLVALFSKNFYLQAGIILPVLIYFFLSKTYKYFLI